MNFDAYSVPDLKDYLQARGVTCYFYRKHHLIRLCELASELKLEIVNGNDVCNQQDYDNFDRERRTVSVDGDHVLIDSVRNIKGWSRNLTSLPDIESCDIIIYLYKMCDWNDNRLRKYKCDDGYKLFQANHINDVEICPLVDSKYFYVRCTCVPETRQNDDPYHTWILMSCEGEVKSGGCTCVADNGSCKHCIAFLFAISSFCDRHKDRSTQVCTDIECIWDKPRKTTIPMEIEEIDTRIDQTTEMPLVPTPCKYEPNVIQEGNSSREIEKQLYEVFSGTEALILQTLDPPSENSDSDDDDEYGLFTMCSAVKNFNHDISTECVHDHLRKTFNEHVIRKIEEITHDQADNPEWFLHRKGRVTASVFATIMHFRFPDESDNYILKQVMQRTAEIHAPAISFGKSHEPVARQKYFENHRQFHKNFNVEKCGLHVSRQHPFMAASPDGKVSYSCCGAGLLEIKCSYAHQNEKPEDVCKDTHYHIYTDENDNIKLKVSSPWYIQIQGQMGVCEAQWCDFVFYTKKAIAVDRIYFDGNFY